LADHPRIQKRDAQGNWSVIASFAGAMAVDAAGNLYVASGGGIQRRDAQGKWSVIARPGPFINPDASPDGLAVDTSGNLYVADGQGWSSTANAWYSRIQKRDAQGNWSVIAAYLETPDVYHFAAALAVDADGNLYVAEYFYGGAWIRRRDGQGNWSVIAF